VTHLQIITYVLDTRKLLAVGEQPRTLRITQETQDVVCLSVYRVHIVQSCVFHFRLSPYLSPQLAHKWGALTTRKHKWEKLTLYFIWSSFIVNCYLQHSCNGHTFMYFNMKVCPYAWYKRHSLCTVAWGKTAGGLSHIRTSMWRHQMCILTVRPKILQLNKKMKSSL